MYDKYSYKLPFKCQKYGKSDLLKKEMDMLIEFNMPYRNICLSSLKQSIYRA